MTDTFVGATARGRAPDGTETSITLGGLLESGYRRAYMRKTVDGNRLSVPGRVSTRHGYADRILDFKPQVGADNVEFFVTGDEFVA